MSKENLAPESCFLWRLTGLEPDRSLRYAEMKMGDRITAFNLAQLLLTNTPELTQMFRSGDVVISAIPYPNNTPTAPSILLAEALSSLTGAPVKLMEKAPRRDHVQYYELSPTERHLISLSELMAERKIFNGRKVILVDDCEATGAISQEAKTKLLENGNARSVTHAFILLLGPENYRLERQIDQGPFISSNGYQRLAQIQSNPISVPTGRFLTVLFNLKPEQFDEVMSALSKAKRKQIEQAAYQYFG